MSDVSWKPEDTEDAEEVPSSRTTRSGGELITYGPGAKVSVVWTPPCISVLKIPLLLCDSSEDRPLAIHLDEHQQLPQQEPATLYCTESCWIEVSGIRRFLVWKWTPMFIGDELPHSNDEETDEDLDVDESESEEEGDDVVVFGEDDDTDNEELGHHTINFKVLGVTYQGRQNFIECAKELISEGNEVPVSLVIEEHNPGDPGGIAVMFDTGVEQFGIVCVGYIQKEFKEYMTRCLQHDKISRVQIKHIKLRTQFNPIGLYILLEITKRGRWPKFVVQKCLRAR